MSTVRTEKKLKIGWMHPSWRDLVIDHLRNNAADRKRFIENCGLPGFLLALSQAGGETGERHSPLLVNKQDWAALTRSFSRVIASDDEAVPTVLGHLIQRQSNKSTHMIDDVPQEFVLEVINQTRDHWNSGKIPVLATHVTWYFQLTQMMRPLPASPAFDHIWPAYLKSAQTEVDEFSSNEKDISLQEVEELFALAYTIRDNEPRFTRQSSFPSCCLDLATKLLEKIQARVDLHFEFYWASSANSEDQRLGEMEKLVTIVAKELPSLKGMSEAILHKLRITRSQIEKITAKLEKKEERESRIVQRKYGRRKTRQRSGESEWAGSSASVDVEDLFADL